MNGDAGGRIQRVGEQVVIEIVLHVLVTAAEGVPAVFRHAQARRLLGIAAPSEAVERQGVEDVLVGQRLHGERLLEDAGAALVIDQRVVHRLAAVDLGDAAAEFDRLRHLKAADLLALVGAGERESAGRGGWRLSRTLRQCAARSSTGRATSSANPKEQAPRLL